jgi:large subunit ribosomal protein L29
MAKKDVGKLRGLSPEDLAKEEQALREEIWKLRLQMATGQQQNPYRVRQVRRDLARVLTVRRERGPVAAGGEA